MSENTITQATDNIFLDLGFSAEEADNLLIRSQLMLALLHQIEHHRWTIEQTAQHLKQSNDQIIEVEFVFDKERDRYLVIDLGWNEHHRIYNCFIHLDIKDGKIWIQRNQTDRSFADELVQMGIPKEEIVLGVQPPYAREYTGFGVA
jgi:predicted XRE-type DNA-binding protein